MASRYRWTTFQHPGGSTGPAGARRVPDPFGGWSGARGRVQYLPDRRLRGGIFRGDGALLAPGRERRRGGSGMRVKVWGARGSVPSPGPMMNRYGGQHLVRPGHPGEWRGPDPRRGHRHSHPGPRPGHRAEGQHPAHPPAPRPHPGPDVLPPVLSPRCGDHDLGPRLARGLARGPRCPLHLRSPVARRGAGASLLGLLSRHTAEQMADRLGDDPRGGGEPPGPHSRLSDRRMATPRSATSPTTSPPSARASPTWSRSGSRGTTWLATPIS